MKRSIAEPVVTQDELSKPGRPRQRATGCGAPVSLQVSGRRRRIQAVVTEESVTASIPVATVSEANQREHWAAKHRRKCMQQRMVWLWLCKALKRAPFPAPYVVTLTRLGARKLDSDNLAGAFKHVQDEVARMLKVDDGDESAVSWRYQQRTGSEVGVVVEIRRR